MPHDGDAEGVASPTMPHITFRTSRARAQPGSVLTFLDRCFPFYRTRISHNTLSYTHFDHRRSLHINVRGSQCGGDESEASREVREQ